PLDRRPARSIHQPIRKSAANRRDGDGAAKPWCNFLGCDWPTVPPTQCEEVNDCLPPEQANGMSSEPLLQRKGTGCNEKQLAAPAVFSSRQGSARSLARRYGPSRNP